MSQVRRLAMDVDLELIRWGVEMNLIDPAELERVASARSRMVDQASARRAWELHHAGGWPGPAPRSPFSGRPIPNPPKRRTP